jgi:hypothetical protein
MPHYPNVKIERLQSSASSSIILHQRNIDLQT